jgi:hypothetical protein
MSESRKYFDQYLQRLKNPTPDLLASEDPSLKEFREMWIRIMESGIFFKGGLKGKKLPVSGPPQYYVHQILELEKLVKGIALSLWAFKTQDIEVIKRKAADSFDRLIGAFDEVAPYAQEFAMVQERVIHNRQAESEKWKNQALKTLENTSFDYQHYWKINGPKIARFIAALILYNSPDASDWTIAARVNELFYAFGKTKVNFETLRKVVAKLRKQTSIQPGLSS